MKIFYKFSPKSWGIFLRFFTPTMLHMYYFK
nr:MAG TPA: hypothetical protein [Caudoviricetes sp.]